MGLTVTLRCFHGNFINCAASMCALKNYVASRVRRQALTWNKTEHAYPLHLPDDPYRADLGDVLVKSGYISQPMLDIVRGHLPPDQEMAEFLLQNKLVSEDHLCRALSLQSGLPWSKIDVREIKREVLRSLPVQLARELNVLPFRVSEGRLHVASTRIPEAHFYDTVSRFTCLQVEVQLVTRINYAELLGLL
jgi:hypothetical protein